MWLPSLAVATVPQKCKKIGKRVYSIWTFCKLSHDSVGMAHRNDKWYSFVAKWSPQYFFVSVWPMWISGWGLGAFLRWWPPSSMWADPLIYLWPPPGMSEKYHLFEFGITCCMLHTFHIITNCCQQHPVSSPSSSFGLTGGKHYQKITIPIFRLVLQNFAIPGYFPYILFYSYLFSLLSSGWSVIAVCSSISVRELVKCLESL